MSSAACVSHGYSSYILVKMCFWVLSFGLLGVVLHNKGFVLTVKVCHF